METKAQKAAVASIKEKFKFFRHTEFGYGFKEIIEDVENLKKEYNMDNEVFNNVVEEIYNILI